MRVRQLLVTPKWIGLTFLLILLLAVFAWFGGWQWQRAYQSGPAIEPAAADSTPLPLAEVHPPGRAVTVDNAGALVVAAGAYRAQDQLLVPDRLVDGRSGYWVLERLATAGGSVPVVRGWAATPSSPGVATPEGEVEVVGWLEPSEGDGLRPPSSDPLPVGQLAVVSSADLLSRWPGELYQGYLVLARQVPADAGLVPVIPPALQGEPDVSLQNLGYALQWWFFAGFAIFFWWRMLQADREDLAGARTGDDVTELTEATQ